MDIVCVSHLRWDFVFQRPQHLMTRAAGEGRVFYIEEPRYGVQAPSLSVRQLDGGVQLLIPQLPSNLTPDEHDRAQAVLLDEFLTENAVSEFALWYYTPMALKFTRHLKPAAVIYDCMDELSAFAGAPPELVSLERELLRRADVVFTGGQTLFEAKRAAHANIHAFPSSVDVGHFAQARTVTADPPDQASIPRPRIGFYGVIDERMDYDLLRAIVAAKPTWQVVLIGPTAKVDPADLPAADNLHYLGSKRYAELPEYIAGWDVALLPFALNEATRFISPTKTPEYLAAGKPVVSTPIRDVVRPYGEVGLARIAETAASFIAQVEAALNESESEAAQRQQQGDTFLLNVSWGRTWCGMRQLVEQVAEGRSERV